MSAYSVSGPGERTYPYLTAQSHKTGGGEPAVLLCLSIGDLSAMQKMTLEQARELADNLRKAADDAEQECAA